MGAPDWLEVLPLGTHATFILWLYHLQYVRPKVAILFCVKLAEEGRTWRIMCVRFL